MLSIMRDSLEILSGEFTTIQGDNVSLTLPHTQTSSPAAQPLGRVSLSLEIGKLSAEQTQELTTQLSQWLFLLKEKHSSLTSSLTTVMSQETPRGMNPFPFPSGQGALKG